MFFENFIDIKFNSNEIIVAGDFNCWTNPLTDHIPNTNTPPQGHMEFQQFQSWFGLMDSALTCSDSRPSMTRLNYIGGNLFSSSRIDYIFLSSILYNYISSSETEYFPNSDHRLLKCLLKISAQESNSKSWKKILPCNVSGWRFERDFFKSLENIDLDVTLEQWDNFKSDLINSSLHSQSQRLFSTRSKI